jgi:hypothetical protein
MNASPVQKLDGWVVKSRVKDNVRAWSVIAVRDGIVLVEESCEAVLINGEDVGVFDILKRLDDPRVELSY